ncbi:MAG: RsmB/NOP family class I SAM-dependent RNA methyltransferase [Alphaproteobacteria bacterium]|nr:RsmB/NOP family class I SAM-dependent RNA methyltransferase [Alphaproteobacteria bacterium]
MTTIRLNCAKILQTVLEEKVFFGELKKQVSEQDLPYVNMLILTVLRHLCGLKKILKLFLQKKIPHKNRIAEYLLLSATAEILYTQTAPYAVINETVNHIKKTCDKYMAGMANAILRRIVADKENLRQKADNTSPLPDTFLQILQDYDNEEIKKIADSVNVLPPLDITVKENPTAWSEKMQAKLMPNGSLRLFSYPKIHELPEYTSGSWWVQDVAASLPVKAMGDVTGLNVVDLCAAPGGKTAQLAAKGAKVTALDISESRLNTLQQNMQRLGFNDVRTICDDALHFMQTCTEKFDAVLLDAPCSATGTFRRHPEVLHIKNIEDVQMQKKLQKQMLNECHNILKIGGTLLYSVCSISKEEGEKQTEEFLKENKHFKIIPIKEEDLTLCGQWENIPILPNGCVRTMPYYENSSGGMDSFFICKMQRII